VRASVGQLGTKFRNLFHNGALLRLLRAAAVEVT